MGTPDKVELLLPAQNKKSITAVKNNANAVYFGVDKFNMRAHADNLTQADLPDIVEYCHSLNLKAYLTTNIIVYENELEFTEQLLRSAQDAGIDAIIAHDMGVVTIAKELKLPFHISTQASISNSRAARYYESLGAERLVLARELSLEQIREITSKLTSATIETFIHGAQCTSISGRCYFSAAVYNDPKYSGNRGACLQPCRNKWSVKHEKGVELDYDGTYFINAKDLCMIEYIPELINANIASFKVEGRMREPRYMEVVARCYREAIDAVYTGEFTPDKISHWLNELKKVYNRGFSTGFYFQRPGPEGIETTSSGNFASEQKIQIGKVITYFRDAQAAKIEINHGRLQLGDEIYFEGGKMGTFHKQKLDSIQLKKLQVTETPIATPEHPITIGVGVNAPVKKGDWIYRYEIKKDVIESDPPSSCE
jgi:putative protease